MLKFSFPDNVVPPDRYRFSVHDGTVIVASSRHEWYDAIKNHYRINGYDLPENYKEIAQDQLCRILGPGLCVLETGESFEGVNVRLGLYDYLHGMNAMVQILGAEVPLVDQETANQRAATCASCPANVPVPGCVPCVGILNLIMGIKGKKSTPADQYLKTCAVCLCSTQAMVWVKTEILEKTVTDDQLHKMEKLGGSCWKSRETIAYRQELQNRE